MRTTFTRPFLGLALLTAAITMPLADAALFAYGIDGIGVLHNIDLLTMQSFPLGPTGRTGPTNVGLAIDPNGQLYLGDATGGIFALALNGNTIPIGNPGLGAITGLDWDPVNNSLLVATASGSFFQANPLTGAALNVPIPITLSGAQIESIAYVAPAMGLLTYSFATGPDHVSLLNLANGSLFGTPATAVTPHDWTGVDVDPASGTPYMIGWFDDSWQIANNLGVLSATHLATDIHADWTALAIPVPEPETTAIWLAGAVALTLRRRRRA